MNAFIKNPGKIPVDPAFGSDTKIQFLTNVKMNGGVSNFGNSLNEFHLLFFIPLLIANLVLLFTVFGFGYLIIKNKKDIYQNKLMKFLAVLASLIGLVIIFGLVIAIKNTAQDNFYILAFGLPEHFAYLFTLQWVFVILTSISMVYFLFNMNSISNTSILATILFSLGLVGIYFQYWGFLF